MLAVLFCLRRTSKRTMPSRWGKDNSSTTSNGRTSLAEELSYSEVTLTHATVLQMAVQTAGQSGDPKESNWPGCAWTPTTLLRSSQPILLLLILKSAMPIPVSKQPAATQTIPDVIKCFEKPLTTVHGGRHHLVTIIPDILICSSLACSHLSTWIFLTNRPESVRLGPFPFLQGLTPLSTNMTVPHSIPPLQICRRNAAIGLTSKRDESAYRDEIHKPSTNNLT